MDEPDTGRGAGRDPQWSAVAAAAAGLKAERYWQRSEEEQAGYLGDVGELARELAFILDQAGIGWGDLEACIADASPLTQRVFELGGGPSIEYALCRAVDVRRQSLQDQEGPK